jgi:hypothetical protein
MIECVLIYTVTYARKEVQLDKEYCCDHVPKSAETSREVKVTILWNQQGQTDRIIPNNQPDVIIRDNEKRNMFVDICCSFWRKKCDQERS